MIKKLLDETTKQETIKWEEECWSRFKKIMIPFKSVIEQEGFKLYIERYWVNVYEKKYICRDKRISFTDGYRYCVRFAIGIEDMFFQKYDDYICGCIYDCVNVKSKLLFPKIAHQLNIFQNQPLYIEMTDFWDEKFLQDVENELWESLQEIRQGEYSLWLQKNSNFNIQKTILKE